jgi:hypothetical protein
MGHALVPREQTKKHAIEGTNTLCSSLQFLNLGGRPGTGTGKLLALLKNLPAQIQRRAECPVKMLRVGCAFVGTVFCRFVHFALSGS